jgi:hypothetical protein
MHLSVAESKQNRISATTATSDVALPQLWNLWIVLLLAAAAATAEPSPHSGIG